MAVRLGGERRHRRHSPVASSPSYHGRGRADELHDPGHEGTGPAAPGPSTPIGNHSLRAVSGPVMRRSSGSVAPMIASDTASPPTTIR